MKNYFQISVNWIKRLISYGLINTIRLKRNLKKDCLFKLNFRGYEFFLRGNTVDFNVFNGIFIKNEYDIDLGFYPEIIVDAGANIGAASLYFRMKYPEARIYAIEPERSNFDIMQKNLENISGISLEKAAIWYKDADLSISNPGAEKYAFQVEEENGPGGIVHGMTIETFMKDRNLPRIDLLKIDIEGAERFLFSDSEIPWLKRVRVIMIELHDALYPGTTEVFLKAIEKTDHTIVSSGENTIVFNKSCEVE